MTRPPEPRIELLTFAAADLTLGDWRSATSRLTSAGDMGPRGELVTIHYRLRCIARNLRFQSVSGDLDAAWDQLQRAAPRSRHAGPEPAPIRQLAHLTWDVDRLLEREIADLEGLRGSAAGLHRGRQELACAVVEHITMIEFDPFTVRIHPRDRELTGLDDDEDAYQRLRIGNRKDICARATKLRQFVDVRTGSVTERTWQRVGGYPCLRELALRLLAEEPLTRGRADLPVRLGRRRAHEYASVWMHDTSA